MQDEHDLARFLSAQEAVYADVVAELIAGRKRAHWMWFVFPQLLGLGRSNTARRYGIRSLQEARAYAAHPVLGARLLTCTRLVNAVQGRSATQIFGSPDDIKLHSSMTLFALAAADEPAFSEAIAKYYGNRQDRATLEHVRSKLNETAARTCSSFLFRRASLSVADRVCTDDALKALDIEASPPKR